MRVALGGIRGGQFFEGGKKREVGPAGETRREKRVNDCEDVETCVGKRGWGNCSLGNYSEGGRRCHSLLGTVEESRLLIVVCGHPFMSR